jgi:Protein of unknown function (DUF2934)
MRVTGENKHARDGEAVHVAPLASDEQMSRIHAAIARRAFEIFKSHEATTGNEVADWRVAERELLSNLCFGKTTIGEKLWIGSDASQFCEGSIGVWVAPHQLTIFGNPRSKNASTRPVSNGKSAVDTVFRVIALPNEIDAASARARIHGSELEITAKQVNQGIEMELKAA